MAFKATSLIESQKGISKPKFYGTFSLVKVSSVVGLISVQRKGVTFGRELEKSETMLGETPALGDSIILRVLQPENDWRRSSP